MVDKEKPPLFQTTGPWVELLEGRICKLDKLVFKLCTELKLESKDESLNIFIFV